MNLQDLLGMDESPKLDFKEKWWNGGGGKSKSELIKDVVSIANGNPSNFEEEGFLVVGVSDCKERLHYVEDAAIFSYGKKVSNLATLEKKLLEDLNNCVHPEFLGLHLSFLEPNANTRILLITIPPHPYLLSLSKNLDTHSGCYRKGTVFFRVGEVINVASPQVIQAFELKHNADHESTTINNSDGTKVAMQNSTNNGTQTFNF